MFVTAVCLLFLWTWGLCAGHAQACYCRSLRHSDVADCWSCLCTFRSGLQHHAESRDLPCIICHEAWEVGIPRWKLIIKMEELCHIRLKHRNNYVTKTKQPFLFDYFASLMRCKYKMVLITGSYLNNLLKLSLDFFPTNSSLASCSRRSDCEDRAKRCEHGRK